MKQSYLLILLAVLFGSIQDVCFAQPLESVERRFQNSKTKEVPDFQRHIVPLMSRLGCNGRACHGSFQGRGGFQLSLFGYDFAADYKALLDEDSTRVKIESPDESLIIFKPTDELEHEGGKRYNKGGWEYNLIRQWIAGGAEFEEHSVSRLLDVEITPPEIQFSKSGQTVELEVVAIWEDGTREDVTPLARYYTNDNLIADVNQDGLVTSGESKGDTHIVISYDKAVVTIPVLRPLTNLVGKRYPATETPTRVDELVVEKLKKLGIVPSDLASDAEFLRRVSLDISGTLPTAPEAAEFIQDKSPNKRAQKIEELLNSPGYAAWWATKLSDFTGNNDQQLLNTSPIRTGPGEIWYRWIEQRVSQNVPYDELAEGIILGTSLEDGQSYEEFCQEMTNLHKKDELDVSGMKTMPYYWARREFRLPPERAISFAYAFMGIRIQCAQCHKHPFDVWSKQDFAEFSNFFTGVRFGATPPAKEDREIYNKMIADLGLKGLRGGELRRQITNEVRKGSVVPFPVIYTVLGRKFDENGRSTGETVEEATILGETTIRFERGQDLRQPLMDWLRAEQNPYFAKAFVNRVWANYFGRGIVDPPDDLSLANAPSNAALLDYLTKGFVDSGFDMKWVHREIVMSRTYQQTWVSNDTNTHDKTNFSHQLPRRLPAEVTVDAIQLATASDTESTRMQHEMARRAIAIPTSSERYLQGGTPEAFPLMVFGRSTRESNCEGDRSADATLLQTLFLQNDDVVYSLINRRNTGWLAQVAKDYDLPFNVQSRNQPKLPENYEENFKKLEARLEKMKADPARKQAYESLVKNRRRMISQYGLPEYLRKTTAPVVLSLEQKQEIVEQAYLRTLTRYPNQTEMNRSIEFIDETDDKMNGVRGLLWALVNTKEFVLNH